MNIRYVFSSLLSALMGFSPLAAATTDSIKEVVTRQMVFVEGGTFTMGQTNAQTETTVKPLVASTTPDDDSPRPDELPVHNVTLPDFYISQYEVTQELWVAVMGNNPCYFRGNNLPAESVSWDMVQEFLKKLNTITGDNYRLPTEAEWEFAARGGLKSQKYRYSGSNTPDEVAWYAEDSLESIQPVGLKKPNELGLYDMSGNAFEWCQDWYGKYAADDQTSPQGPSKGTYHVLRGGSWKHNSNGLRTSFRTSIPTTHLNKCGFRLAKSAFTEPVSSENTTDFTDFTYENITAAGIKMVYRKKAIENKGDEKPALVIYMHGGSSKGNDNTTQMKENGIDSIYNYLTSHRIPSVFVIPQCPSDKSWGGPMNLVLKELITSLIEKGEADPDKVYLFGGSMGGTGTWGMLSAYPTLFTAAMPVAGNPSKSVADSVAKVPVFTVMGTADVIMSVETASNFVSELKKLGGECVMEIEEGWTHEETCIQSYTTTRLDWVFSHTTKKTPTGILPIAPNDDSPVVRTRYYSLDGKELPDITGTSFYIRKQTLSNGKVITTKHYSK